ncbi:uncharacterized protein LOC111689749 [Lucilia cuprina]|uniref:uncharacterized protein LOC111689749 n=1 Tax=Lucilia cuprina TaxID=7375 RepID=UPI001F056C04|nr:uncharacterized protein LOC111689749 [Lucilia cuprina]
MKFCKIVFVMTLLILSQFKHSQGKNYHKTVANKDFAKPLKDFSKEHIISLEQQSLTDAKNNNNFPQPVINDSTGEHNVDSRNKTTKLSIQDTPTNIHDLSKKLLFNKNTLKLSKSPSLQTSRSNEINGLYKPINSQKVYCHQIIKSDLNTQGNIIDSVQHICHPLPKQTTSVKTLFRHNLKTTTSPTYTNKEKRFERLVNSTPARGYNCRRIMNSELNERGEIVDTVTKVCDPPTTTTTTTRKPTVATTTKATTTTPKPLVKVCRPVMNSYLSEEGEIIDSVTMVCKMEKVV